ncbi:MAG: hypothetical protein O2816_19150, partial [Planctomycetota bacterium]|nr:hypothetical protein [Planctomycetota bacterium]
IDAGWVAQYEEQHSGWLAQQVLAIYREVGLLEQAIEIVGHDQVPEQTLRELARARADAGDIAGAIQIYRARLDEDPGDSHALHGLRSTDPDALCTFLQGRLAEVGPDARLEMSLGHTLVLAGRMEEALAIAQRYLSDDADELRGWYLYERIDPEAALEHARRRADSDPAWGPALAGALEERGDEEGATLALTSCLEHGRNEDAIDLLGDLDPARAADYLGAWSLANPYDVELQVRWAEALVDAEDAGGAVDVLAQLIARDPRDPDREAASKLLDMDAPRFFASVRPAVESSGDASAWWDLARWYEEADDVEEQRAALDRAIELNPWNQCYRNAREDLD